MPRFNDGYWVFRNGLRNFNENNYVEARKLLEESYKFYAFRVPALARLIKMDYKEGKYADARRRIEDVYPQLLEKVDNLYAFVENNEYNFISALKHHNSALEYMEANEDLFDKAKILCELGEPKEARKILYSLERRVKNPDITFLLIRTLIDEGRLEEAYNLLKENKKNLKITKTDSALYRRALVTLEYLLKKLKPNDKRFKLETDYIYYALTDDTGSVLLEHVKQHKNQRENMDQLLYHKDIDFEKLILDSKEKICGLNPIVSGLSDTYRIDLGYPVSSYNDKDITTVGVNTVVGTNEILTIYPVDLSSSFDLEKLSTSEEIKLKRTRK